MNETLLLVLAGSAGLLIGALFFGGLFWTVREGLLSKRPTLLFVGSLLFRSAVALGGFYVVGRGRWERLVMCLIGFVVARAVVTRLTRAPYEEGARRAVRRRRAPPPEYTHSGEQEARRAPQPR